MEQDELLEDFQDCEKSVRLRYVEPKSHKRILALNKQRGYAMEKWIERFFNEGRVLVSKRTPLSGNSWLKGDNHILLHPEPTFFVVSCKLSAAILETEREKYRKYHRLRDKVFSELERDVTAMKSIGGQFGIVIVKWHEVRDYLAFIPKRDLSIMAEVTGFTPQLNGFRIPSVKRSATLFADMANYYAYYGAELSLAGIDYVAFNIYDLRRALVEKDKEYE